MMAGLDGAPGYSFSPSHFFATVNQGVDEAGPDMTVSQLCADIYPAGKQVIGQRQLRPQINTSYEKRIYYRSSMSVAGLSEAYCHYW
jgi:hypothetical protein